jgi:hypothetical protein
MMLFECFDSLSQQDWTGELELVVTKDAFYELIITGHGSRHHAIVAKHSYGAVLCIPHIGMSCELAALADTFWNCESMARHIPHVDAITISTALSFLPEFYLFD